MTQPERMAELLEIEKQFKWVHNELLKVITVVENKTAGSRPTDVELHLEFIAGEMIQYL